MIPYTAYISVQVHKSITTLQGEDIVFLATDINLPGKEDEHIGVADPDCFDSDPDSSAHRYRYLIKVPVVAKKIVAEEKIGVFLIS